MSTIIPKLVDTIIDQLKELSVGDYGVEDISVVYSSLQQIKDILDNTIVIDRSKPKLVQDYVDPEFDLLQIETTFNSKLKRIERSVNSLASRSRSISKEDLASIKKALRRK
jgi:hypothetical protein